MEKWKEGLQSENLLRRYKTGEFIKIIVEAKPIKEFDMDLFFRIIEKVTVLDGEKIVVTLIKGYKKNNF